MGDDPEGEAGDIALTPEETCQFIEWWMAYPSLWDPEHRLYKDRVHKRDSRRVIADLMHATLGRAWSEGQVHRKICSLKGQFNNQKRKNELLSLYPSIAGGKKPKVWTHFQQLRDFLDKSGDAGEAEALWSYKGDYPASQNQYLDKQSHRAERSGSREWPSEAAANGFTIKQEKQMSPISRYSNNCFSSPSAQASQHLQHNFLTAMTSSPTSATASAPSALPQSSTPSLSAAAALYYQLSSMRSQPAAKGQPSAAAQMTSSLIMSQSEAPPPALLSAFSTTSWSGTRKRPLEEDDDCFSSPWPARISAARLEALADGGDDLQGGQGAVNRDPPVHSTSSPTSILSPTTGRPHPSNTQQGSARVPNPGRTSQAGARSRLPSCDAQINSSCGSGGGTGATVDRTGNGAESCDGEEVSCDGDDDDDDDAAVTSLTVKKTTRRDTKHIRSPAEDKSIVMDDLEDVDGDKNSAETSQAVEKRSLQHETYGRYVAERLQCVGSRKKVLQLKAAIDALLHKALMEELSD